MKVDVKIAGASYSEVPAVLLPLKNGGRARPDSHGSFYRCKPYADGTGDPVADGISARHDETITGDS